MSLFTSVLIKFLQKIPYTILHSAGKTIANLLYFFPNSHKKITKTNLELVFPDHSESDLNTLLKRSLFHSSMNLLESGLVWGNKDIFKDSKFIGVSNLQAVKDSLNSDRGVLIITPHMGNIEIIINFLGKEFDCTIPYSKPKQIYLDKIITSSREGTGVRMVNTDAKGLKEIIKTLKENNMVAIAADQVPKEGYGHKSIFFGREIYSMTLIPKLKKSTNCAVHSVYCQRRKNAQGFNLYFSSELELSDEIQEGVDRMNSEFEKCIMKVPEQYSWEYKKFKRSIHKSIYQK